MILKPFSRRKRKQVATRHSKQCKSHSSFFPIFAGGRKDFQISTPWGMSNFPLPVGNKKKLGKSFASVVYEQKSLDAIS